MSRQFRRFLIALMSLGLSVLMIWWVFLGIMMVINYLTTSHGPDSGVALVVGVPLLIAGAFVGFIIWRLILLYRRQM